MIRRRVGSEPVFYFSNEIGRSPMSEFFDGVDAVVGDWDELARPLASAFSRDSGRPTDHVLYLKMFLVGYFQNVVYDTRLCALCSDSIAIRRFLGLTLVDSLPDHSSISRVRDTFAEKGGLGQILEHVVGLCVRAGLVDGGSTHVDGTLVKANALVKTMCSLDNGLSVHEHLDEARERSRKLAVKNSEFYSPADSEARLRKKGSEKVTLCYMGVHVTDSKNQIVVAARMDYGDSAEVTACLPAIEQAQKTLEAFAKSMDVVVGDKGFNTDKFHNRVEELGLRPATFCTREKKVDGHFSRSDFHFDAERNLYRCPWGKELGFRGYMENRLAYVSKVSDCSSCPLRDCCLGAKSDRKALSRSPGEAASERNSAFVKTPEGKAHLKKRSSTVEPPFGHAKRYGGLELINCRGLAKAGFKFMMAAVAWNMKKLMKASGTALGSKRPLPKPLLCHRKFCLEQPNCVTTRCKPVQLALNWVKAEIGRSILSIKARFSRYFALHLKCSFTN